MNITLHNIYAGFSFLIIVFQEFYFSKCMYTHTGISDCAHTKILVNLENISMLRTDIYPGSSHTSHLPSFFLMQTLMRTSQELSSCHQRGKPGLRFCSLASVLAPALGHCKHVGMNQQMELSLSLFCTLCLFKS